MISVRKLSVDTLENKSLVRDVSFELAERSVLGVYGPNGSGKTNLLKAISGVNASFVQGDIWIDDFNVLNCHDPRTRSDKIIYLGSDYPSPFEVRIIDLLNLGYENSSRPRAVDDVMKWFDLAVIQSRFLNTLSDGEKQWAMFARAVVQNPKVLVLDESFSKLDLDRLWLASKILKTCVEEGMTVLTASHDLNFLSECSDYLLIMNQGELCRFGLRKDVFQPHEFKALYPNLDLYVVQSPNSGRERVLY
jgi:ABC-type cobalamin/Fe3+-siderophores transport system ATPase subunit